MTAVIDTVVALTETETAAATRLFTLPGIELTLEKLVFQWNIWYTTTAE